MARARFFTYAFHNPRFVVSRPTDLPDVVDLTVGDEHGVCEATVRLNEKGLLMLAAYLAREVNEAQQRAAGAPGEEAG